MEIKEREALLTETEAVAALAALGHGTRLAVFRLLMQEGPDGLPAGQIARRLEVAPSTLSSHLSVLELAGLLRSARVDRHILYAVDYIGTRRLISFLTEDCCEGRPELCGLRQDGAATCGDLDCDPSAKETDR